MTDSFDEPIGLITELPNDSYHSGPGVSKSQLDLVHRSPSLLEWDRNAPVDEEADKAVDLGNIFEALLLEPERFAREYIEGPKDAPRNTNAGKAKWAEVEEQAKALKATILPHDVWRQVHLMRDSTLAHPVARRALEADSMVQASYYWFDEATGLRCRCRPDWMLEHVPFVIDVKTVADIARFERNVEEFRYHVQDAFYTDGLSHYYDEPPVFAFLAVSTSRSAGRYPVHVYELDGDDRHAGRVAYKRDLETYAGCKSTGDWTHVEPLKRPWWARKNDENF